MRQKGSDTVVEQMSGSAMGLMVSNEVAEVLHEAGERWQWYSLFMNENGERWLFWIDEQGTEHCHGEDLEWAAVEPTTILNEHERAWLATCRQASAWYVGRDKRR